MTAASRLRVAKPSAFAAVVVGAGGVPGDAAARSADAARAFPMKPIRVPGLVALHVQRRSIEL